MKITYLTSVDISVVGAPANHVTECVEAMAKQHEVLLIHAASRTSRGIGHQLNYSRMPVFFPRWRGGWRYFEWKIARLLRQRKTVDEIIYLRMSPSRVVASALAGSRKLKVMEINGLETLDNPHFLSMALATDLILVGTNASKALMSMRYPLISGKIFVHSNVGANFAQFKPRPRNEARALLGLAAADEIVLHVSGFQAHHDFVTLLAAFTALKVDHPAAKLMLVGDGFRREEVEAAAADLVSAGSVVFAGAIMLKDLESYIAAADVCVNAMTAEKLAHGNFNAQKTFEYIACGRAVVESCDFSMPIPEWACGNIICVAPEDSAALAAGLKAAIRENSIWQQRTQRLRNDLLTTHSWSAVIGRTLTIVEDFRNGRREFA